MISKQRLCRPLYFVDNINSSKGKQYFKIIIAKPVKLLVTELIFIYQFLYLFALTEDEIPASKLKNHYKSISEHKDITKLLMVLTSAISSTKAEVLTCLEQFIKYQYIWQEDKEKSVDVCIDMEQSSCKL